MKLRPSHSQLIDVFYLNYRILLFVLTYTSLTINLWKILSQILYFLFEFYSPHFVQPVELRIWQTNLYLLLLIYHLIDNCKPIQQFKNHLKVSLYWLQWSTQFLSISQEWLCKILWRSLEFHFESYLLTIWNFLCYFPSLN